MFNPFKQKSKTTRKSDKFSYKAGTENRPDKPRAIEAGPAPAWPAGDQRRIIGVILNPHTTEKTNFSKSQGWYSFKVGSQSSKQLIKRAIEDRYGVKVLKVGIINQNSRRVRLGRIQGRVPGFKKAMVKIKEGQSIEFT